MASLSLGAGAYMHFRLHAQYANAEEGGSRDVLTLFLRHVGISNIALGRPSDCPQGDVVVMEGADVQKYYE